MNKNKNLSGLILLGLVVLFSACKREILHDLSEAQANSLVARLHEVQIEGQKERQPDGSWVLSVDDSQVQKTLLFLSRARLLQSAVSEAPDSASGLFSQEARGSLSYQKWISEEIRQTLRSLPGVLDAKVHLYLPKQDGLFSRSQITTGSGSVLLIVEPKSSLVNEEIAQLVAGAAGLEHRSVAVLQSIDNDITPAEKLVQQQPLPVGIEAKETFFTRVRAFFWSKTILLSLCALILIGCGSALVLYSLRTQSNHAIR